MENIRREITQRLCYTDLGYQRINKKLKLNLGKTELESMILRMICLEKNQIIKKGKNYYLTDEDLKIRVTINSNTFRVITVDRIKKS